MSNNILGYVWYSQKQHFQSISYLPFDSDENDYVSASVLELMKQDKMQQLIREDQFPTDLYAAEQFKAHKEKKRHIFNNGFTVVSSESAEVLRAFNLGEGGLYPVRLWRQDRTTRIPGEFFYLTHGNRKQGFLPERSPEATDDYGDGRVWSPPPNPVDDQLFYSPEVLGGADIWRDDLIYWGLMLSDQLAQALKKAGVAKDWLLLRCPVVEG